MTIDKQNENSSKIESVDLKSTGESSLSDQDIPISKQNIPSFSKILITDDGKEESNKALNYGVSLSNYSGAELLILRILEDIKNFEDVSVQGTNEDIINNKEIKREVKGEVIDEMEKKINRCKDAGCENKISYKFRIGNAIDEIVREVKDGDFDLIILRSSHVDSWVRSLFSDSLKIVSNIRTPVLIVQ